MKIPYFKYHLNPIKTEVIVEYSGLCSCCGIKNGWKYVGPFYCENEVENICPWCIKDGSDSRKMQLSFIDEYGPEELDDVNKREELLFRTPGYFSAQGDSWPVHCNDYCKLIGATNWAKVQPFVGELEQDIRAIKENNNLSDAALVSELSRPHSPLWAHLFACNHCKKHRLVADYE